MNSLRTSSGSISNGPTRRFPALAKLTVERSISFRYLIAYEEKGFCTETVRFL